MAQHGRVAYKWLRVADTAMIAIARLIIPTDTSGQYAKSADITEICDLFGRQRPAGWSPFFWMLYEVDHHYDAQDRGIRFFESRRNAIINAADSIFVDACVDERLDLVKKILPYATNIWPAIHQAARLGHYDVIAIISRSRHLDWQVGRHPSLALYNSCFGGNQRLIQHIVAFGANDWDEGLAGACAGGHRSVCKIMTSHGAINCITCFKLARDH